MIYEFSKERIYCINNVMRELLDVIDLEQAILITAPPGWGKTYKLLSAIKATNRNLVFIFPLRALCDEVYISALEQNIRTINLRQSSDRCQITKGNFQLVLATPETYGDFEKRENYIHVLDEFHLFYYWGETFRAKMLECYHDIFSSSLALICLTATLMQTQKEKLVSELELNYKDIYQLDFGNQSLRNYPSAVYYYPRVFKNWLWDDLYFSPKRGTSLIFCQYRNQVAQVEKLLNYYGYNVLACVGGGAEIFMRKLQQIKKLDYIVATSVVSHGVNLPNISHIYFLYMVENLDFYLQMLGRGGRTGHSFEVHVMNKNYFSKKLIIKGIWKVFLKRFSNKLYSLLY